MASSSSKAQKPVGSAAWISTEKENIVQLVKQELEEIEYPVCHEMLWLNEHMAEIFAKNQINLAELFKTPGRLRGKTPRTIRQRNAEETRVPLSEIFSSAKTPAEIIQSPKLAVGRTITKSANNSFPTNVHATSETKNVTEPESQQKYSDLTQNLNSIPEYNTDSGYHGMPEEDKSAPTESQALIQPLNEDATPNANYVAVASPDRRTTEDSFHSAHENIRSQGEKAVEPMRDKTPSRDALASLLEASLKPSGAEREEIKSQRGNNVRETRVEGATASESKPQSEEQAVSSNAKPTALRKIEPESMEIDHDIKEDLALDNLEDIGSPSDGSTPERPFMRKSSLNLASLPAREPLTTKKSVGGSRVSRTSHVDIAKLNSGRRASYFTQNGGHRITKAHFPDEGDDTSFGEKMDIDNKEFDNTFRDADADTASRLYNKSSTQRLAERISMLGKHQPSRPTKSTPAGQGLSSAQVLYPELPTGGADKVEKIPAKSQASLPSEAPSSDGNNAPKPSVQPNSQSVVSTKITVSSPVSHSGTRSDEASANVGSAQTELHKPRSDSVASPERPKSFIPILPSPRLAGHQRSATVSNFATETSTTPTCSPERHDGPLSASRSRFQSIVKSARGLFSSGVSASAASRVEGLLSSSPSHSQTANPANNDTPRRRPEAHTAQPSSPSPRKEAAGTRIPTEEEQRKQQELAEHRHEEERQRKIHEQERQKASQIKAREDKAPISREERGNHAPQHLSSADIKEALPSQRKASREPEASHEPVLKNTVSRLSTQPLPKNDRRPVKPTREPVQKPKPQPVSIRVGSALSRQMPLASTTVSSSVQESNSTATAPSSTSKQPTLKKQPSNTSLHTASSNSSFKSSVSSQSQRKVQVAADRKKQQEERELRRKEELKRDLELKRVTQQQQQQEESRRQELRNRAEAERREHERDRLAVEDPKKAAQMQAIEKRRLENARRHERQGSQNPVSDLSSVIQSEKFAPQSARNDLGSVRPPSRLGPIQQFSRSVNHPAPNPAKPPKRAMEEEAGERPPAPKPSAVQQPGDRKRRKTEEDLLALPPVRPTLAPPVRQSILRKEPAKPQVFVPAPTSHQPMPSMFKTTPVASAGQPQRPVHHMDMAKFASGKIPFAEVPFNSAALPPQKGPTGGAQRAPAKPSPKYPNGEDIHLPEIATDSEDEDSDADILPVPSWAQPEQLETILRVQEGMEADSIFGPIAPFSLEETFKSDKRVKKYRERTSSANWSGADGLTQEEIRRDLAERQRLRLNGGWTFGS